MAAAAWDAEPPGDHVPDDRAGQDAEDDCGIDDAGVHHGLDEVIDLLHRQLVAWRIVAGEQGAQAAVQQVVRLALDAAHRDRHRVQPVHAAVDRAKQRHAVAQGRGRPHGAVGHALHLRREGDAVAHHAPPGVPRDLVGGIFQPADLGRVLLSPAVAGHQGAERLRRRHDQPRMLAGPLDEPFVARLQGAECAEQDARPRRAAI